jgi:hypothetical protein
MVLMAGENPFEPQPRMKSTREVRQQAGVVLAGDLPVGKEAIELAHGDRWKVRGRVVECGFTCVRMINVRTGAIQNYTLGAPFRWPA